MVNPDAAGAEARRGEESVEPSAELKGPEGDDGEGAERLAHELSKYREAARFRRHAEQLLRTLGLTFASWRILEAASRLIASKGDACNHAEVARDIELDEASVLRVMRVLSRLDHVSHDIASEWKLGFRVILTEKGAERLRLASSALRASMTDGRRARLRRGSPHSVR